MAREKRLKEVNWNHLYCFHEVARSRSLRAAAEGLGVASSTISEQLKKLEHFLEKELFNRTSRGMSLTDEGKKLFVRTKQVFEAGSKLLDDFLTDDIGGYPVSVGIEDTISSDISLEFTSQYWDLFTPFGVVNTSRQAEHDILVENILNSHIDWGISVKEPNRKRLESKEIGSFEVSFYCSEELLEKFKDPKEIINNIPFAKSFEDSLTNKIIEDYLRLNGCAPREIIYSDHNDYIKKLCLRSRCVMVMAENPLEDYYQGLAKIDLDEPLKVKLFAIWRRDHEKLISIKKLKQLIHSNIKQVPLTYDDHDLQIEVSDVASDLLVDSDEHEK
ncbi:LysR family transcriptional regulator [Halobacteriovorax sp. GB3]|uniref:LysR family transcriptional regulator n=1 Tax=Halobacteriovorax sp. GB3 TaxID=2719615 RepID=UPI0023611F99|nr:LysR family transcriptional regulator [Halobacteriovorax sp. GB3]MDD0851832.1 LysR family transcriptional regulator [Halobacteriovorax sp. GB3]